MTKGGFNQQGIGEVTPIEILIIGVTKLICNQDITIVLFTFIVITKLVLGIGVCALN